MLWVQQEDQTGQVMQQILAERQSLEVIFGLYMSPRKPSQSVSSLLSFFISLNRMLLSSDLVTQALLSPVNTSLLTHLQTMLVLLSNQLSSPQQHHNPNSHSSTSNRSINNLLMKSAKMQGGQTGATPTHSNVSSNPQPSQEELLQQQALHHQWTQVFGHNRGSISIQQITQLLKELLEIFQLLVHAAQQQQAHAPTFIESLDLISTIQRIVKIAEEQNLVILQSISSHLLSMMSDGYTSQQFERDVIDFDSNLRAVEPDEVEGGDFNIREAGESRRRPHAGDDARGLGLGEGDYRSGDVEEELESTEQEGETPATSTGMFQFKFANQAAPQDPQGHTNSNAPLNVQTSNQAMFLQTTAPGGH